MHCPPCYALSVTVANGCGVWRKIKHVTTRVVAPSPQRGKKVSCNAFDFGCPGHCATCRSNESAANITVGEVVAMQEDMEAAARRESALRSALARAYAELSQEEAARNFNPPLPSALVDEIKDALGM